MSEDSRIGTLLADRYRLNSLLGEGGMGKVYAAEHVLMRKRLAVKILHRALTSVPDVVTRFEREAMAAAHIEHPNVATATDFGKTEDGSVFLVLEFVEGTSLRDEIAKGPIEPEVALRIAAQIASALAAAHALGIVHRDLKPENVMLVDKGGDPNFVKVLDFGIAKVPMGEGTETKAPGEPITQAGMVFGTPEYMAPEQALGQDVDGRADIYALGVMLYEMLCGMRPFASKSHVGILGQQLSSPVPRFVERAPTLSLPPSVEQVVFKMLDKERKQRWQTAEETASALSDLLQAPMPKGRLFTQLGGSPRAVLASEPGEAEPQSGSLPLPSFATESDSGLIQMPTQQPAHELSGRAAEPASGGSIDALLAATSEVDHDPPRTGLITKLSDAPPMRSVMDFVDRKKRSLPGSVQRVPALVLLFAVGLVVSAVLIGGIAIWAYLGRSNPSMATALSASTKSAPPPVAPIESDEPQVVPAAPTGMASKIEEAKAKGLEALLALHENNPDDAQVLVAIARAQVKSKDYASAVQSVSKALERDPTLNKNDSIASAMFVTAQSKSASAAAFQLLEGPMGARGADIVYDIAQQAGVRKAVKKRAEKFLLSKEFAQISSPALNVAAALRGAKTCRQRHGLLLRAKNVGDRRSLSHLEPLTAVTGCGKNRSRDCYSCLRKDERLSDAISAIEKRHPEP